jgi:hypothetical protein
MTGMFFQSESDLACIDEQNKAAGKMQQVLEFDL